MLKLNTHMYMYTKYHLHDTLCAYTCVCLEYMAITISHAPMILTSYNLFDISLAFSLPFAIREPNWKALLGKLAVH